MAGQPVSDENKTEFVDVICRHKLADSIASEVASFKSGIYDVVRGSALYFSFDTRG